MVSKHQLLARIDAYKALTGISKDSVVSSRLFDDGKKIAALRGDGDITLGRFSAAMAWLDGNWPQGAS